MPMQKAMNSDPLYVRYKDKRYDINTDYKVALKCIQIGNDRSLSETERVLAIEYKLFGVLSRDPEEVRYLWDKAELYLRCGEPKREHEDRTPDMDFDQDYNYIEASFQSDYGIDLSRETMSWYRFYRLLNGMTNKAILSRVREIRTYDLSDIKDPKQRAKMAKAKEDLALIPPNQFTDEEAAAIDAFDAMFE